MVFLPSRIGDQSSSGSASPRAGALAITRARPKLADWRDELVLAAPPLAIFVFVSAQTGFTIHFRYVLAVLPFLFVWAAKSATVIRLPSRWPALAAAACLAWVVGASLWVYPHSLSYFNELAGGPGRGHLHLVDSGIAWGQDLLLLRKWHDEHPDARPFFVAAYGFVNPSVAGIEFEIPPLLPDAHGDVADFPWRPGWYAIDVNYLQGSQKAMPSGKNGYTVPPPGGLRYFEGLRPSDRVGYSFRIFHLSETDVHRLRRQFAPPVRRM